MTNFVIPDIYEVAGATSVVLCPSAAFIWDTGTLSLIKDTGGGGGGGGAVTIADGADIAEGTKADAAWVSGSGTTISLLKNVATTMAKVPGLSIPVFDYTALSPSATQDVWTFKTGGSGGSLVSTVTINYTDATKAVIVDVART